jgi:hypothetical protein
MGLWIMSTFLIFFGLSMMSARIAFAVDRSLAVHSRIEGSLGNILHRSDYLVIVNRLDQMDDGGASAASSGQIRKLPGLAVGVDSAGRVMRNDEVLGEYNGGVSISIILDPAVQKETFDLIQRSLPEIAGGLRDVDEFRISRARLRQAPAPTNQSPQVSVNNNMSPSSDKTNDLLKQLAIGLALLGLFVWILSRLLNKERESGFQPNRNLTQGDSEDLRNDSEKKNAHKQFAELDPFLTGLYLIRAHKNSQMDRILSWAHSAEPSTQRLVLKSLPGWISSSLEKTLQDSLKEKESKRIDIFSVYLEISVLEQNLINPVERQRALLSWFPATYLRDVPSHQRDELSRQSRMVLWYLRPELGDFVKEENDGFDEAIDEPSPMALQKCFSEIESWNSKAIIGDRSKLRDTVSALASMINQMKEFGPIESRLKQAREKLSSEEVARLETLVVSTTTPLSWGETQIKEWLRKVDPQDFVWWCHLLEKAPPWKLETLVRPLRLSMFKNAQREPLHLGWTEAQRKSSAERILTQLREIHQAQDSFDVQAA